MNGLEYRIESVIKLLKMHNWENIVGLAILFQLILLKAFPLFSGEQPVRVILERYTILATILVIPLALKLFSMMIKKEPPVSLAEDAIRAENAIRTYKKAYYIRLYMISGVTLMNILLFSFSRNMNFLWLTVVLFLLFMFCKPSYPELMKLTKIEEGRTGEDSENRSDQEKRSDSENRSDSPNSGD